MTRSPSSSLPQAIQIDGWEITVDLLSRVPAYVLLTAKQTHGPTIVSSAAVQRYSSLEGDGVTTSVDGPPVAVKTADCLPLALLGKNRAMVLHISRKSLLAGILNSAESVLPKSEILHAVIGPHICADHFTFAWEGDQIKEFKRSYPDAWSKDVQGTHLDLRKVVVDWLENAPVTPLGDLCTYESTHPSYRREKIEHRAGLSDHLALMVESASK